MASSMKKIIGLTTKDFFTGIAPGAHVDTGGIWAEAQGINAFVDLERTVEAGLLQTSSAMTVLSASVDGTPMAYTTAPTQLLGGALGLYVITDEGFIGRSAVAGVIGAATEVRGEEGASALVQAGTGLETLETANDGLLMFYFHNELSAFANSATTMSATIGVYGDINSSNPSFTDNKFQEYKAAVNGVQSNVTLNRPAHKFRQKVYHGHDYRVGSLSEDSSGDIANVFEDLDLPKNQEITALEDDGDFLVIASTNNKTFDETSFADTNVWFWDTSSTDISRSWPIKDSYIIGLRRVGGVVYALCPNGLWAFNYQTRPFKVLPLVRNGNEVVASQANPDSKPWIANGTISSINNAVVWGGSQVINSYGPLLNNLTNKDVYHKPYADLSASTGDFTLVAPDANFNQVFGGTNGTSETTTFNKKAGGGTGFTAKSVYIPMGKEYVVQGIQVILGEPLASGDDLFIDVQADEDETEQTDGSTWGTISFATYGAVRKVTIFNNKTLENLKINLTFNGGNVKIKNINVYGHPAQAPQQ